MKIREVIVVEGRHDEALLKQCFECDVIVTGGLALSDDVLERIRHAQQTRGVIILTDPDSPGNRIRERINQAVPGCRNVFMDKKQARTEHKVGVEHASREVIKEALVHQITFSGSTETITVQDMYMLGLSGQPDSKQKRTVLGRELHLGDGNAKTMRRRLNAAQITKEQIKEILYGESDRDTFKNEGNR